MRNSDFLPLRLEIAGRRQCRNVVEPEQGCTVLPMPLFKLDFLAVVAPDHELALTVSLPPGLGKIHDKSRDFRRFIYRNIHAVAGTRKCHALRGKKSRTGKHGDHEIPSAVGFPGE